MPGCTLDIHWSEHLLCLRSWQVSADCQDLMHSRSVGVCTSGVFVYVCRDKAWRGAPHWALFNVVGVIFSLLHTVHSLTLCATANTTMSNGDVSGKDESRSSPIFPVVLTSPVNWLTLRKLLCVVVHQAAWVRRVWQQTNKFCSLVQIDFLKLGFVYPFL